MGKTSHVTNLRDDEVLLRVGLKHDAPFWEIGIGHVSVPRRTYRVTNEDGETRRVEQQGNLCRFDPKQLARFKTDLEHKLVRSYAGTAELHDDREREFRAERDDEPLAKCVFIEEISPEQVALETTSPPSVDEIGYPEALGKAARGGPRKIATKREEAPALSSTG